MLKSKVEFNFNISTLLQIKYYLFSLHKTIDRLLITLSIDGLMSISWTQKVKLFYAVLLANNSHCSGVM